MNFLKRLFCFHKWEYTRPDDNWYDVFKCVKCGKEKLFVQIIDKNC